MKTALKISLMAALAVTGAAVGQADAPKPAAAPVEKPAPPHSVFVQPHNAREGRDPFYPDSVRPYQGFKDENHTETPLTAIAVKGVSYENGHAMVIINNHTFAEGDEGDVITSAGRVHVRLAEIRPESVVIQVNGGLRELAIPK